MRLGGYLLKRGSGRIGKQWVTKAQPTSNEGGKGRQEPLEGNTIIQTQEAKKKQGENPVGSAKESRGLRCGKEMFDSRPKSSTVFTSLQSQTRKEEKNSPYETSPVPITSIGLNAGQE